MLHPQVIHRHAREEVKAITAPEPKRRTQDTLALRLIGMRHELGLSQREASLRTGVPYGTWQGMENGRATQNLHEHVQAIEEHLGYDRDWLMWGDNRRSLGDNTSLPHPAAA